MNDRSIARTLPLLVIGALVFAYVVARAVLVSFTWDESWTFVHHVLPGELYPAQHGMMSGNHHLLNVWGAWVGAKLFGQREWALRIPNLLAMVVYAFAASRIALRAGRTAWSITGFLLLLGHPYLLEFFALARGYGLAIGLMLMSVWHLVQWSEHPERHRHGALMFLCAGLSVLSHYIMLNFFIAVSVVFALRLVRLRSGMARWRAVRWPFFITVVVLTITAPQVLGVLRGGGLIWGCGEFWSCSVRGLLMRLIATDMDAALIGPLVLLCALFLLEAALQRWDQHHRATATVAAVTLLCAAFIAAEGFLLGMEWPRTRTALYLMPLLFTVVVLWLQANTINWPWVWWPAMLVSGAFAINTIRQANLTHTSEWPEAAEVGRMIELVRTDRAQHATSDRAALSTGPVTWGSLGYYFHRFHITDIDTARCWPNQAHQPADYYIVEPYGQPFDTAGTELMFRSVTNVRLYSRRAP